MLWISKGSCFNVLLNIDKKKSALLADKSACGSGIKNENVLNRHRTDYTNQLLENSRKRKVHSTFTNIIWGAKCSCQYAINKQI